MFIWKIKNPIYVPVYTCDFSHSFVRVGIVSNFLHATVYLVHLSMSLLIELPDLSHLNIKLEFHFTNSRIINLDNSPMMDIGDLVYIFFIIIS